MHTIHTYIHIYSYANKLEYQFTNVSTLDRQAEYPRMTDVGGTSLRVAHYFLILRSLTTHTIFEDQPFLLDFSFDDDDGVRCCGEGKGGLCKYAVTS